MEDNAKTKATSDSEMREIKVKSEIEMRAVTVSAKKAVKQAEDTGLRRSLNARELLRAKGVAASRKVASAVTKKN